MSKKLKFSIIIMMVTVMLFSTLALACDGNEEGPEPETPTYKITVADGKADVSTAAAGATVTLTPDAKTGYAFTNWTSDVSGLVITNNSFKMPASNVIVTANFQIQSYTLTVTGGTATVGGTAVTDKVVYGAEVTLTPAPPETGYTFTDWSGDVTVTNNKFTMPDKNVSVTANYKKEIISTLTLAGGKVTFKDDKTTAQVKEGDPFPEYINNNTGTDLAGWYEVDDESKFWNQTSYMLRDMITGNTGTEVSKFTMPAEDITVAPFFVGEGQRPLIAASSSVGAIDAGTTVGMTATARAGTQFFETNIGTQIGAALEYSGSSGGRFRIQTSCAQANAASSPGYLGTGEHTFYFWFTNMGTETITFTARQVNSGSGSGPGIDPNTGLIVLEPGQSKTASITITLTTGNNNALTFIDLGQAQTNAKLGIVMSKNP